MQVVSKEKVNDEGLTCPKCGEVLKPSLMEEDMFVCPDCVERFKGSDLRAGTAKSEFDGAVDTYVMTGTEVLLGDGADPDDGAITVPFPPVDVSDLRGEVEFYDIDEPTDLDLEEVSAALAPVGDKNSKKYTKPKSGKQKRGHGGLMFVLGILLGAIVSAGCLFYFFGVPTPLRLYLGIPAAHDAIQADEQGWGSEGDDVGTQTDMATSDSQTTSTTSVTSNASMSELLSGMGEFDNLEVNLSGDAVVDVPVKGIPVIVHVVYKGNGVFDMKGQSSTGASSELLSLSGKSDVTVTTYFAPSTVEKLVVEADGAWSMCIMPMDRMLDASVGSIEADNSDVAYIDVDKVSKISFKHDGDGPFTVHAAAVEGNALKTYELVDANGDYSADIDWTNGKAFFYVESDTTWSMSVVE